MKKHSKLDDTKVWIVGDKKTPVEVEKFAKTLSQKGLETEYLGVARQVNWGKRHKKFFEKLPFNNETRRNIGYLHALGEGCQRLISIDDDNWPHEDDFISKHEIVGEKWGKDLLKADNGFFDVSGVLETKPKRKIFLRGFPFSLRNNKNAFQTVKNRKAKVVGVNLGLWVGDPDIDAITWLNGAVKSIRYKGPSSLALRNDTWTPINTQNTSVIRELIPAFFCIPMGYDFPGGPLERYGDVWAGYFLQSLIRDTDYIVTFGRPIVDHKRNPHDFLEDLRKEYWGMILTDWVVGSLKDNFNPKESKITDRVRELSEFVGSKLLNSIPPWASKETHKFLKETAEVLSLWAKACDSYI